MSAHLVFLVMAAAGLVLGAWIARCARGEVEAAECAWNDSPPEAAELRAIGDLLAFATAHVRSAPRGAQAVMRSYCEVARAALERRARCERLAQARDLEETPGAWRGRGLPLRLFWLKTRLICSRCFRQTSRTAALAAELRRLDADVREALVFATPPRRSTVTHV